MKNTAENTNKNLSLIHILWNASRFVIMNLQDEEGNFREMAKCCENCCGKACADTTDFDSIALKDEDKWMISKVNEAVEYVTRCV